MVSLFPPVARLCAWPRRPSWRVAILWLILASSTAATGAGIRPTPLDYHATVINGRVTGSSFMVGDGVAVTNAHVLNGARKGSLLTLAVPGRRSIQAEVLAVSRRMDLALLRVSPGFLPIAPPGARGMSPGSTVVAAGVVAGANGPGQRATVSGQITSSRRELKPFGPGVVAHMPGIRQGFSGGPVFDRKGRIVGMVAALRPTEGGDRDAFVLTMDDIRAETRRLLN